MTPRPCRVPPGGIIAPAGKGKERRRAGREEWLTAPVTNEIPRLLPPLSAWLSAGSRIALSDGVEQLIDLGIIGDRTFVNNASFGAYAEVERSPA
jgi:hypothetical protein